MRVDFLGLNVYTPNAKRPGRTRPVLFCARCVTPLAKGLGDAPFLFLAVELFQGAQFRNSLTQSFFAHTYSLHRSAKQPATSSG